MRVKRDKTVLQAIMEVVRKHPQPTYNTNWVTRQINENDPSFRREPTTKQSVNRHFSQNTHLFERCGWATYQLVKKSVSPESNESREEAGKAGPPGASPNLPAQAVEAARFKSGPAYSARGVDTNTEEIAHPTRFVEGAISRISVNAYERDPAARQACIEHYGATCRVPGCGFNFGRIYGEVAEGFIHIHHVKPLSEIGEEHEIDPVADLRPVCANCHAIIHRGGECRTLEEIGLLLSACRLEE